METLFSQYNTLPKAERYEAILPHLVSLIEGEDYMVTVMANVSAMLHDVFGFFWVGFYIVHEGELRLGPFQGSVACSRIGKGRGVCGTAWQEAKTIIVEDVDKFPGHIACSSLSRSEIVVPVIKGGAVIAVLDIDSDELSHFDETDKAYLERIVEMMGNN